MFNVNKYILEAKDKEDLLFRLKGFDKLFKDTMIKTWNDTQKNKPVVLKKKSIKKTIKKES